MDMKYETRQGLRLVGIDGKGGSGKTSTALEWKRQLEEAGKDVVLFHLDDFIRPRAERYGTGLEQWEEYYFRQWDVQAIKNRMLVPIKSNDVAILELPVYNKTMDTYDKQTFSILPHTIVLIEGVFCQRAEWRPFFDYVLYVTCSEEERVERILQRDIHLGDSKAILQKYTERYWVAEDYYEEFMRPEQLANAVLDHPAGRMIKKLVQSDRTYVEGKD